MWLSFAYIIHIMQHKFDSKFKGAKEVLFCFVVSASLRELEKKKFEV